MTNTPTPPEGERERIASPSLEDMIETARCITANVEAIPGWNDSAELVTIHAHAYVLTNDLPLLSSPPPGEGVNGKLLREALQFAQDWRGIVRHRDRQDQVANKNTVLRFCEYIEAIIAQALPSPPVGEGS